MDFDKLSQSKLLKRTAIVLGLLIIILASFGVGVFVGYNKARFSYAWSDYYDRNFGRPPLNDGPLPPGGFGFSPNDNFVSGHGTSGSIISVGSSSIAVSGNDGIERTVLLSTSTIVREHRGDIRFGDLRVGEPVVVIGSTNNQGQIEARFIRAF